MKLINIYFPFQSFLSLLFLSQTSGFGYFVLVRLLISPHRAWLHVAAAKLYARTLVATLYYSYHRGRQEGLWIRFPALLLSPWPSQIWNHRYHMEFLSTIHGRTASLLVTLAEVGIYMEQKHSRTLMPLSVGRWALPIHKPLKSWHGKHNSNAQ